MSWRSLYQPKSQTRPPPLLSCCPSANILSSPCSRRATLATAARLALALLGTDGASATSLAAWRHVELMADAHSADASLAAAITAAQQAPAYVRAHYLLALLHWLLADRTGKSIPSARRPPNDIRTNDTMPADEAEGNKQPARKRKKPSRPATSEASAAPSPVLQSSDASATGVTSVDPRPWWLLALILSSEMLPRQEVQAGALLKPLLAVCQNAADLSADAAGASGRSP